jgi:hypothetical protein
MKFHIIQEPAHDLKQSMMDVGVGKRTIIPIWSESGSGTAQSEHRSGKQCVGPEFG